MNLVREVSSIEVSDEIIAMNKRYQKLCELEEQFNSLIESTESIYGYDSKETKALEKQRAKIAKESRAIFLNINEQMLFVRMFKGAMMLKAFKEVEREVA